MPGAEHGPSCRVDFFICEGRSKNERPFCLRQSIYLYMKIYLYDELTNEYIGELSTFSNRPNLPVDTMLIYNKVKYLIVASEQLEGTNNYTATVKKA